MLARLWWKEFRLFWPVWLFIVLAALVTQAALLWFLDQEARTGVLGYLAVGFAFLYAAAAGSAAFAGEREQKTLLFLDTLPVPRRLLWGGKASFALVSSVALVTLLLAVAVTGSDRADARLTAFAGASLLAYLVLMFEAVGWGLLWSSLAGNALSAAALTVCSVGVVTPLIMRHADVDPEWALHSAPQRFLVALLTTAASAFLITRTPKPSRPPRARKVRAARPDTTVTTASPARVSPARPPRFWASATRSLIWETRRAAWPVWPVLFLIGVVGQLAYLFVNHMIEPIFAFILCGMVPLTLGVQVFGTENRDRTYRFLAHNGAGAGVVWSAKVVVWTLALLTVGVPTVALSLSGMAQSREPYFVPAFLLFLFYGFCVSLLCGMTIRRGITAGLVAFVATFALVTPLLALLSAWMLSPWGLLAVPAALLVVSRLWCRDWLLDRPGYRRWVKLALLLIGAFGLIAVGHAARRVAEIPALPPNVADALLGPTAAPMPDAASNAAPLYLKAIQTLNGGGRGGMAMMMGTTEVATPPDGHEEANRAAALGLVRQASLLPRCAFAPPETQTIFSHSDIPAYLSRLANELDQDARGKLERGDLDGAWDDALALTRMAGQLQRGGLTQETHYGSQLEKEAIRLALDWAADARQTPERLRAALKAYRGLPPRPTAEEVFRGEWALAARTLNLPAAELRERAEAAEEPNRWRQLSGGAVWTHALLRFGTTPWEMTRARRAFAELFAAKVLEVRREPWQRTTLWPAYSGFSYAYYPTPAGDFVRANWELERDQMSTPLASLYFPPLDAHAQSSDMLTVGRRALEQVLALRSWQLRHGGNLPDRLAELVPEELDRLPNDPYANEPFTWTRLEGQVVQPFDTWVETAEAKKRSRAAFGRRLLVSVGPNRKIDTLSEFQRSRNTYVDDQTFLLPAAANDPKVVPLPEWQEPEGEIPDQPFAAPAEMGAMMRSVAPPGGPPPAGGDMPGGTKKP